ncbi:MAG: hypothetical protein IKI03_06420 [Clostridia bacterium]|nr:hypothetical protein [Clostridia bacterium]
MKEETETRKKYAAIRNSCSLYIDDRVLSSDEQTLSDGDKTEGAAINPFDSPCGCREACYERRKASN